MMAEFSCKVRIILEGTATVDAASVEALKAMSPFDIIRPNDEFFSRAEIIDYSISNVRRAAKTGGEG